MSDDFEIVSHVEIKGMNFDEFDEIFLFSWTNSLSKMREILSLMPVHKIIFISTLAVYANFIFFQFSRYPKNKLRIEDFVLENGGKVMRFGFFSRDILKKFQLRCLLLQLMNCQALLRKDRERVEEIYF